MVNKKFYACLKIVPTLCVGMHPVTLRVAFRSERGAIPTQRAGAN